MPSYLIHKSWPLITTILMFLTLALGPTYAQNVNRDSLVPQPNAVDVPASTPLSVTFDNAVDDSVSFDAQTFLVYGEKSGAVNGQVDLSADRTTLTFTPDTPFHVGEKVTAIVARQPGLQEALENGFVWEFEIAPESGSAEFVAEHFTTDFEMTSIISTFIDGDTTLDLAFTGTQNGSDVLQLAFVRDGLLQMGASMQLPDRVRPLYSADLNRDGLSDFVLIHRGSDKYSLPPRFSICHLTPSYDLVLEETISIAFAGDGYAEPRAAVLNDFNADGYLDIIIMLRNDGGKSAVVYLNDGTGHFDTGVYEPTWFDTNSKGQHILSRDLNNSGYIDAGTGHDSSQLDVFLNDGSAGFNQTSPDQRLAVGDGDIEYISAIDLDDDLLPDIAAVDLKNNALMIHICATVRYFPILDKTIPVYRDPVNYPITDNPNWLQYGDVDADGDLDLAMTGSQTQVWIALNDNGTFDENVQVPLLSDPVSMSIGDMNGDLALDLVVGYETGEISILYNNAADLQPPDAPTLIAPQDTALVAESRPTFEWQVPADSNANDSLHFRITLQSDNGDTLVYTTQDYPDAFAPQAPVPQGSGTMAFVPPDVLADTTYTWFVEAFDGVLWSDPSSTRSFTVDSTSPVIHQVAYPQADYDGTWFAIGPDSLISVSITYSEKHPDSLIVNAEDLGGPFVDTVLVAGQQIVEQIQFDPVDNPDGEYPVNVRLVDRVGWADTLMSTVGIDANPPIGTTARVDSDTSSSETFRVSWNSTDDGTGSGPSGEYRVQYREDGGPWTVWIERTSKPDSLFTGSHLSTYEFEAAGYDNVGFLESFNQVPEARVTVNIYAEDSTPPPPPLNVRANGENPSAWQKGSQFTVRWDLPNDESGIKQSFWKLGQAPTSPQDYQEALPPTGPANVTVDDDGVFVFFVWLQDNAGNVSHLNTGTVDLRRDSTLPAIQQITVDTPISPYSDSLGIPWFNSKDEKSFVVSVQYSEANAELGELLTDGLTNTTLTNSGDDLPSGDNVRTTFLFDIQNPADRVYTLSSSILDSANNKSSRSKRIGMDGISPSNSLASAPAISATDTFTVKWSAGTDGNGSGIASYELYYKIQGGNFQLWEPVATQAGSRTFTGQDGVTYVFESIAVDHVGHREAFSANGESVVTVDLAANDQDPPASPINLQANGAAPASPWSADPEFTLTWSAPNDESGVVASYWKLGSAPVSNSDTTATGPAEGPMPVTLSRTGKQWLYLWLIDEKGNVDFETADSVLLRLDNTPPRISNSQFINPGYGVDWYNPATTSEAQFEITYDESYPDTLAITSTDFDYDVQTTDVQNGVGMKKVLMLPLSGKSDAQGELVVSLVDSAKNRVQLVDTLRLDSTPPQNARASSPDVTANTSFQVNWTPGEDTGVGVTDTFDVFVKLNDEGWNIWLTDFVGRSAPFDGEDGQTYHFEVIGRDFLGNKEARTYEHESTTLVDITASDSLAPSAPVDLTASGATPSPWQKSRTFSISWTQPDDPSGIAKAWYKLGTRPQSNTDTTGSFTGDPPFDVNATQEYGQTLWVWLQDGADNVDIQSAASVLLRYDATVPAIDSLRFTDPQPAFADRWYNPTVPPHQARLNVFFRERVASQVELQPSDLFEDQDIQPEAGTNRVAFDLEFQDVPDADVELDITVTDSAGNSRQESTIISFDSTPPTNTIAQSPDTTGPGEFIVFWDINEVVERRSGLNDTFDVRLKIDDAPWELWKPRHAGTSVTYTGEVGRRYAFEVAAYDNVGNRETWTNTAETVTLVVEQFDDSEAPGAPTDVTVNGESQPRWSKESEFELSWTPPSDPSGISTTYYKFNEPPQTDDDFDGTDVGNPPITIAAPDEGVSEIFLWLEDGAGNRNFENVAQTQLKYDGTPPDVLSSLVANAVFEEKWLNPDSTDQAQIRITYSEQHPDSLLLFFSGSDTPNMLEPEPMPGNDQQVDFLMSIVDINDGCYPITVVFSDSAGNVTTDSMQLCLDSTPPEPAVASSPERSITGKFVVSWAEMPGADEGSGLSGEYDLRIRVGNGEWFDLDTRIDEPSYTYVGAHGNTFAFEVAAWDNAGNREPFTGEPETITLVDTTFEDSTPPGAPLSLTVNDQNPSPWQNDSTFVVQWKNPTDPSGIEAAFFKIGAPPTSNDDFTDSVAVDDGEGRAEVQVTQEPGQPVYVWLQDGRENADFNQHASILLRYDATLPQVNELVTYAKAQQTDRFNPQIMPDVRFNIAFEEAHPDSLVLQHVDLGTKTIAVTNNNVVEDTIKVTWTLDEAADGAYWIVAMLQDSAGNVSEPDSVQLFLDSKAPRITFLPPDSVVNKNTSIPIQATVFDENELQSVELVYWQGGARTRERVPMTLSGDSTYSSEIPASVVGNRGVEYLIVADDGVNRNRYPLTEEQTKPMFLRVRLSDGLTLPEPLPSGTEENAYRMLALPLEVDDPAPQSVLEDDFGAYDIKAWRFFRWNPLDGLFMEYPETGNLRHGRAYWMITSKPNISIDSGPGKTVNTVKPYTIVLKQGWNDIGVPFHFNVDWNDIISASAIDTQNVQGPHTYSGRWEYPFENTVLRPWQGYSIYSDLDDISLVIPALEAPETLQKRQPFVQRADFDWVMEIKARSGDATDVSNYFGCFENASLKWDYGLDFVEAPEMGQYVSVYFAHDDWELDATRYTTDFRPPQKGHVWEFEVASNKEHAQVKLSFRSLRELPGSLSLKLLDQEAGVKIDLKNDSTYSFQFSDKESVRHFTVYAGDSEFMEQHQDDMPGQASQFELVQNYPNPFNNSTVISYELRKGTDVNLAIYNLLAQKVRQLRSEYQEKGFYQVTWDARDDDGKEMGTGVYILRLETPEYTSTCKMVYMR